MKRFIIAASAVLSVLFFATTTFAQVESMQAVGSTPDKMIVPPESYPSQFLGQDHRYSVTFRGNGEAVITARITFSNELETSLDRLSLRIPRGNPTDLVAYQVIQQGACMEYGIQKELSYPYRPPCLAYAEPDSMNWYGPAKYQKATTQLSGDTAEISLPQPVKPTKSGSIILYYRAVGYTKKDLVGAFHYTFETLKTQDAIQSLQVGITTDADHYLKGTKGKVNYRFEETGATMMATDAISAPAANSRMDNYFQQIGQGELVKTASNLQPLDSYTVKGSYAETQAKLYAKEIVIGFGVFLVLILVTIWIVRLISKGLQHQTKTSADSVQTTSIVAMFGLSILSAAIMMGYTILIVFLSRNFATMVTYDLQLPVTLLLMIISIGVYGLLLFGPSVFMGFRYGLGFGLGTAGLAFGWLILMIFVFIVLGFSGRQDFPVSPMPFMGSFDSSSSAPGMSIEPVEDVGVTYPQE